MNIHLKIKVQSLVAEARIIRNQETRIKRRHEKWRAKAESRKGIAPPNQYFSIHSHRTLEVRREARSSHLAYGFLRGCRYDEMEASCYTPPDWKRVETLVKRYGDDDSRERMQRYAEWFEDAKTRLQTSLKRV